MNGCQNIKIGIVPRREVYIIREYLILLQLLPFSLAIIIDIHNKNIQKKNNALQQSFRLF